MVDLRRLRQLLEDPPHRVVTRLVQTGLRTGLLRLPRGNPVALATIAVRQGLGIRTIHRLHAATDPDRLALSDERRKLTYADTNAEIDALGSALVGELGARRGQPVAIMMENRVEYALTWFALSRIGVTTAHISRYATAEEITPLLERSGAEVIVVSDRTWPVVREALAGRPDLSLRVLACGDLEEGGEQCHDMAQLVARHAGREAPRAPRNVEVDSVVYTSGTTGRPKGAVRDFSSVGALQLLQILERLPIDCADQHLVVAPMYHSAAQAFTLINSSLGNTIHFEEKFDAERTLGALSREAIGNVFLVPTMIHRLLDLPPEQWKKAPLPDLKAVISGAALFSSGLRKRAIERFGPGKVFDFYGATELGWVTLVDGHEMTARPGTVGRAIAGQEIGVFDEQGQAMPPKEVGKVYTRSAKQQMRGYLADRKATEETRMGDWATVDDLGWLDQDGYLFLTGRNRDMVISGGVNVYPVEVENALAMHPQIREVAVIGLPDSEWGERLTAVVVPSEGFDPQEAAEWARSRVAPYKIPRRWEMLEVLPRNPTGKVLKRELRERFS